MDRGFGNAGPLQSPDPNQKASKGKAKGLLKSSRSRSLNMNNGGGYAQHAQNNNHKVYLGPADEVSIQSAKSTSVKANTDETNIDEDAVMANRLLAYLNEGEAEEVVQMKRNTGPELNDNPTIWPYGPVPGSYIDIKRTWTSDDMDIDGLEHGTSRPRSDSPERLLEPPCHRNTVPIRGILKIKFPQESRVNGITRSRLGVQKQVRFDMEGEN